MPGSAAKRRGSPAPEQCTQERILNWLELGDDALNCIKRELSKEFELGLSDEEAASVKMLITYVRELARGDESGSYLALDLGGTHFRVLLVELQGFGEPKVSVATHELPTELLISKEGRQLFDFIALRLLEFVQQYKLKRRRISLGFTFSFPCKQYGLTQSILVKWCKGFNVGGVVGTDVVRQLKDALKRQLSGLVGAYVDVVAVINDTTGTLVACANLNKHCRIGLIVGTGFNACYMEQLSKCEKWPANYTQPKQVIINCEWGAMGDHKQRRQLDQFRCPLDSELDADSVNPHQQTFEKMVSGMYLGELLRLAIIKLVQARRMFTSLNIGSSDAKMSSITVSPKSSVSISAKRVPGYSSICPRIEKTEPKIVSSLSSNVFSITSDNNNVQTEMGCHRSNQCRLFLKNSLNGRHMSMLAKDELSGKLVESRLIMQELGIKSYTEQDLTSVIQLASRIIHRSAYLVAVGVSALLERLAQPFTVIGYDGSVIKYHPYFLKLLTKKCAQLTSNEFAFEFMLSSDGSGIGAAVVAAALHKERRPLYVVKPGKLYELHFSRGQNSSSMSLETGSLRI